MAAVNATHHSVLQSSFPVLLPSDHLLFAPDVEFNSQVRKLAAYAKQTSDVDAMEDTAAESPRKELERPISSEIKDESPTKSRFMEALLQNEARHMTKEDLELQNKTFTENADVTNISAKNPLVDLFYELSGNIEGERLGSLLDNAWKDDPLMTVKIIFNTRSIHLGKSDKYAAYKAFGWLAKNHPLTFLTNLRWLVRPIIPKKTNPEKEREKAKETGGAGEKGQAAIEEEDFDMIDPDDANNPVTNASNKHDVRYGVSHGYWKDLLNLVALAANDKLAVDADIASVVNNTPDKSSAGKRMREWDEKKAKELRKQAEKDQHERVLKKLESDGFYRGLHLTVARLFVDQLKEDIALLKSDKKSDVKKLSLAGKWAPSQAGSHDKHTFIASSIAEALFPNAAEVCPDATNRELYLRHAREAYRSQYTSPLRKALSVVEREVAANKFEDINYERVPSLAMDRYTPLFIRKDYERVSQYIERVGSGKSKISGAILLPSTLVAKAETVSQTLNNLTNSRARIKAIAEAQLIRKLIEGQWNTLVQRIRDSGTLESTIAVCDVSGSMAYPQFKDGTNPMSSAIGLSLLMAEITEPPFGGAFITFSESPTIQSVGGKNDSRDFVSKVQCIRESPAGFNTDFVAVFEDVILPMAIKHNLKQDEMVKQVFVFSDMQFDQATSGTNRWTSSFDRVKAMYAEAGYEMPKLIFWNLADRAKSKPTTMDDANTALVSGYSQGMLKVFLDGGGFEAGDEEVVATEVKGEDGVTEVKVQEKMNPLTVVEKAVSHDAYGMLEVID